MVVGEKQDRDLERIILYSIKKRRIMDKRTRYDRLADNLLLRMLISPYKRHEYRKLFRKYNDSEEPDKIKLFKNCNNGKRCFVIGNGPSLQVTDLNKLNREITMAANEIWNIFDETDWRPTYYFCVDARATEDLLSHIENMNLPNIFLNYRMKKYEKRSHPEYYYLMQDGYKVFLFNDKTIHISKDISKYFSNGGTVLFAAVQFAIYTGIKEIYLLGVDFNYSHIVDKWGRTRKVDGVIDYFDGKNRAGARLNYNSVLYAWQTAKKYCDEHEIKIYNATRGGKLEVFERVNFDTLFGTM